MCLIGESKILLLDEPTSGLDVESKNRIIDYIKSIKKSRTIILSTQNLEEAEALADRVCVMS